MGLPQELVRHIAGMLRGDVRALKGCSLTCKAMFASSRPFIYETLCLTQLSYESILAPEERQEFSRQESSRHSLGLHFLSHMDERGLLQYTRQVYINMHGTFTPDNLKPHIRQFQSLDRVHTLTIEYHDTISWTGHWEAYFIHFYPTLTSLTLRHPLGHRRSILLFALQFPNLENLCLESFRDDQVISPGLPDPVIITHSPPLRGHLRLVGVATVDRWLVDLAYEAPSKFNFRSIELEDFFGSRCRPILEACAETLENLTIAPDTISAYRFSIVGMDSLLKSS
jgi:hypothetical protein